MGEDLPRNTLPSQCTALSGLLYPIAHVVTKAPVIPEFVYR